MRAVRFFELTSRTILVTCPICTPRNTTGAPIWSPFTEPSKNSTFLLTFLKNLSEPKTTMPATTRTKAPRTKAPMRLLLACLLIIFLLNQHYLPYHLLCTSLSPGQKVDHFGVFRLGEEVPGLSRSNHRFRVGVEKDRIVSDRKDARQLMGHNNYCSPETISQFDDQLVKQVRADGIEPCRRFIEEEDFRV